MKEISALKTQVESIRAREDYLGKKGLDEGNKLNHQLKELKQLYWLRKRACFDLIEVFTDLYKEDEETFKAKVGLDRDDFDDLQIQELLQVFNEVKVGLDFEEDEDREDENDEDDLSSDEL